MLLGHCLQREPPRNDRDLINTNGQSSDTSLGIRRVEVRPREAGKLSRCSPLSINDTPVTRGLTGQHSEDSPMLCPAQHRSEHGWARELNCQPVDCALCTLGGRRHYHDAVRIRHCLAECGVARGFPPRVRKQRVLCVGCDLRPWASPKDGISHHRHLGGEELIYATHMARNVLRLEPLRVKQNELRQTALREQLRHPPSETAESNHDHTHRAQRVPRRHDAVHPGEERLIQAPRMHTNTAD